MKPHRLGNIQVCHPVSIGKQKGFSANILFYPFYPSAGHGIESCVHNGYFPRFGRAFVDSHIVSAFGKIECDIRGMEKVIRKIFLDNMLLVTRADDKLVEAIVAIELHDMPDNGHTAQFHHGLGFELGLFRYAGAKASRKDDSLHTFSFQKTFLF